MVVEQVSLRSYRSYARLELALHSGVVLVVGENGAGKTNLLEALHVGTQGFSPRTRSERDLIRFGEQSALVRLAGRRGQTPLQLSVNLSTGQPKRAVVNGARLQSAEQLRRTVQTLVFTPDRLAVVKSGPAARRAYLDRALGRLFPARAALPAEYGAAIAQRNAALRRVSLGSGRETVAPWTEQVAALGTELVEARRAALAELGPCFAERLGELGLPDGRLAYDADPPTVEALEARLERDLDRGATGIGPHLDDIVIAAGDRELRGFGSQGEQRLAVLALLLAEAEWLAARGPAPLLLLDDVLSELDRGRRATLAARIQGMGQTVITATSATALPVEPEQLVEVAPGEAR
ncbi:MAG TPA: DNA replication and repair protein RecF [Gaiellaceae bacterium]|nr:DNA replication and repair protein RecF [Gaiellaceae bacterium]